jgi:hypothetical protein
VAQGPDLSDPGPDGGRPGPDLSKKPDPQA